jgi:hypothetical protein
MRVHESQTRDFGTPVLVAPAQPLHPARPETPNQSAAVVATPYAINPIFRHGIDAFLRLARQILNSSVLMHSRIRAATFCP